MDQESGVPKRDPISPHLRNEKFGSRFDRSIHSDMSVMFFSDVFRIALRLRSPMALRNDERASFTRKRFFSPFWLGCAW